jgi:hypothetical protein
LRLRLGHRWRRLDLRLLCRRLVRFARRFAAGAFDLGRSAGIGSDFWLSRGWNRRGGRLRLVLWRNISLRLCAGARRLGRRSWSCGVGRVARRRIGHGARRDWIYRLGGTRRWRGGGCRRWCGNAGRPPAIDADGVGAARRTGHRDQNGLQRRSAEQNAAGGEHEKWQFRSVSVGHGSRVGVAGFRLNPLRRSRLI